MAKQSQAWLLTPLGLSPCAIAQHEIVQYLNSASTQPVPFALAHCATAIFWQDEIVPVMNLSVLTITPEWVRDLTILAYQDSPGDPLHYIALALQCAPERITVDDSSRCELPKDNAELWEQLAIACFTRDAQPIPIFNIKRLCSAEFRDFAAQRLTSLPAHGLSMSQTPDSAVKPDFIKPPLPEAELLADEPTVHVTDKPLDDVLVNEVGAAWDDELSEEFEDVGFGDEGEQDDELLDNSYQLDDEDLDELTLYDDEDLEELAALNDEGMNTSW